MKYNPKVPLWPHQLKALAKMKGKAAFGLLMAMRTGKSAVVLADFGQLELDGKVKDFLLIAPAGVYRTWLTAMREHFSEDLRKRCFVHTYSAGAGKRAKDELQELLDGNIKGPRILLMNIEALSRPGPARGVCEKFLKRGKNYVAIDECFVAGTKIATQFGSRAIETIKIGELVNGSLVKAVIKNQTKILAHIKLRDGRTVSATTTHPFFTDIGWMKAEDLEGRILFNEETVRDLWENNSTENSPKHGQKGHRKILQHILLCEMENETTRDQGENLYRRKIKENSGHKKKKWYHLRSCRLEQRHSDEVEIKKKIECKIERDWSQFQRTRRQWKTIAQGARDFVKIAWTSLVFRISNSNQRWKKAKRLSSLLQSGHWKSETEISNRMRWSKPQCFESAIDGQKERCQAQGIRVESVTIEKLANPIDVFNLELEGTPHFFAEGVLVHNCTVIKNHSKRTVYVNKFIRPLATYRRILSGLATPRSPLDLFYQFEFLDWEILGWRSYYSFRAAVAIMATQWFGGRSVQVVVGYRDEAIAELQKLIEPASFRVPFRPNIPSTWSIREVEMTPEQKRHYNEIKEFATTQLSATSHVTATVVIAQLMRMHQVLCGHVKDEDGTLHTLPENKTAELLELLEDYAGKAIIWCSYDHDVRKLSERLTEEYGEGSVARFWGGNERTRESEEGQFKNDPKCRFMVATPAAGGRGRTWTCADLVVYYSSTDNLEHRDQSEQRAMGIDKKRQVDFVDLIHPGTVEMKILEALRKKINMSSVINGDAWRDWII